MLAMKVTTGWDNVLGKNGWGLTCSLCSEDARQDDLFIVDDGTLSWNTRASSSIGSHALEMICDAKWKAVSIFQQRPVTSLNLHH